MVFNATFDNISVISWRLLRTKLYDKRDDFNFPSVRFLFIYIYTL